MRTVLTAVGCVAVLATAGCGGSDADATQTSDVTNRAPGVPQGVAAQYRQIADEVAAEGGEQRVGPWQIAYIVEPAEGWFETVDGERRWRAHTAAETHHIEILPIEASTGRLVPNVPITLELLDAQGDRVARRRLPMYYAEFFHYANNFAIPRDGTYTLRATLGAPDLRRHGDRTEAPALAEGATATFEDVELAVEKPGQ
jgi:hypothetical protein